MFFPPSIHKTKLSSLLKIELKPIRHRSLRIVELRPVILARAVLLCTERVALVNVTASDTYE